MIEHDKRLTPARADLADERLRGIVPAERYVAGVTRQVVWPSAPLRREPRPDAGLDTEALMGELASVYEEREGWSWVQLQADRYVGYVPSEALREPAGAPTSAWHRTHLIPPSSPRRRPAAASLQPRRWPCFSRD